MTRKIKIYKRTIKQNGGSSRSPSRRSGRRNTKSGISRKSEIAPDTGYFDVAADLPQHQKFSRHQTVWVKPSTSRAQSTSVQGSSALTRQPTVLVNPSSGLKSNIITSGSISTNPTNQLATSKPTVSISEGELLLRKMMFPEAHGTMEFTPLKNSKGRYLKNMSQQIKNIKKELVVPKNVFFKKMYQRAQIRKMLQNATSLETLRGSAEFHDSYMRNTE